MAMADHQPYLMVGDGHYCTNLRKFFCVAAPIEGPHGEVLGALDVSSYDSIPNFDVMSLVADSAVAIENSLHRIDADHILFRFHNLPQWIDTPREGIVVVRSDGKIASANRVARRLLGHSMGDLQAANFHDLFECDLNRVFGRRSHSPSGMVEWSTRTGLTIVGRIDCSEAPTTATNTPTPVEPPPTSDFRATPPQPAPAMSLKDMEMAAIEAALERLNGNVTAVSRELGISRNTIYRRLGAAVKSQG
jgi:transcriptional regulator of acetoin/glycerol metabolism